MCSLVVSCDFSMKMIKIQNVTSLILQPAWKEFHYQPPSTHPFFPNTFFVLFCSVLFCFVLIFSHNSIWFNQLTNICLWFQVALVAINVLGESLDGNALNTIVSEHSPLPVTHYWTYTTAAVGGAVELWFCKASLCHQSLTRGWLMFPHPSTDSAEVMTVWAFVMINLEKGLLNRTRSGIPHISRIVFFMYLHYGYTNNTYTKNDAL